MNHEVARTWKVAIYHSQFGEFLRENLLTSILFFYCLFQLRYFFYISVLRAWKCSEIITEKCNMQNISTITFLHTSRTLGVCLNARHFTASPFTQRSVTGVGFDRLINHQPSCNSNTSLYSAAQSI
jgi:hypothetical protein